MLGFECCVVYHNHAVMMGSIVFGAISGYGHLVNLYTMSPVHGIQIHHRLIKPSKAEQISGHFRRVDPSYGSVGPVKMCPLICGCIIVSVNDPKDCTTDTPAEKLFIAANFFSNEDILPYWSDSLLKFIAYVGPANVFVSIVESYSYDGTRDLLRKLDARLADAGVARRIVLDDKRLVRPSGHEMETGARIEYLAAVRNLALEPLVEQGGFARVLFSNDVFVEPESLVELLRTADGAYDMACSLDFGHWGCVARVPTAMPGGACLLTRKYCRLYDDWVIRDRAGHLAAVS